MPLCCRAFCRPSLWLRCPQPKPCFPARKPPPPKVHLKLCPRPAQKPGCSRSQGLFPIFLRKKTYRFLSALYVRAYACQLLLYPFVAPVNIIGIVNDSLAFGNKTGYDKSEPCP